MSASYLKGCLQIDRITKMNLTEPTVSGSSARILKHWHADSFCLVKSSPSPDNVDVSAFNPAQHHDFLPLSLHQDTVDRPAQDG